MAQLIYREWFVKFRFPGHQKVKLVESPLGMMPEGWEVKKVGEVCSLVKRGISPRYSDESKSVVINQKCIRNGRVDLSPSRRHTNAVPKDKMVRWGDVLVNSTGVGTLGRLAQVLRQYDDTTVDTHVTIVRPDTIERHLFGLQMMGLESYFESQAKGATGQTELGRASIVDTPLLIPIPRLQKDFEGLVSPVRSLAVALEDKNTVLRQTRDLLLPKLISGQLDVSELDIDIGEAAA
ncbi:MAG: hypothetical protein SCH98_12640 [Deferrisomatales bacterium]|nr:hypothetical protein [Deferrisomatales bacterium]